MSGIRSDARSDVRRDRRADEGAGLLDALSAAYANQFASTPRGLGRIDDFLKELDLAGVKGDLHEAVFLGSDMNTGDGSPITFIGHNTPTGATSADYTSNVHGYTITNGSDLFEFAMSDPGDQWTALYFGSGDHTITASKALFRVAYNTTDYVTVTTVGSGTGVRMFATRTGTSNTTSTEWGQDFYFENASMQALAWDNGVGYQRSVDGAAWETQVALVKDYFLNGAPALFRVGQHNGTVQGFVIFNKLLSSAELAAVHAAAQRTVFTSNMRYIWEGDSIPGYDEPDNWPLIALRTGAFAGAFKSYDKESTSGHTAKGVYDQAVAGDLDGYAASSDYPIIILQAGVNDMVQADSGDYTVTKVCEHLTGAAAIYAALGIDVYLCTLTETSAPRTRTDGKTINSRLVAKSGDGIDFTGYTVVDMDAAMTAAFGSDYYLNASYTSDNVHPTETAAKEEMADTLKAVLKTRREP